MATVRSIPITLALMAVGLGARGFGAETAVVAPPAAVATADGPLPQVEKGYLKLGFEHLASFSFTPPPFDPAANPTAKPATGEEQIPAAVKAWSGKKAIVTGYMMPVKMDPGTGLVTELLLTRHPPGCCYGTVPNLNEWIVVKLKKGVPPLMDLPVSFYGELKVGAMFENGYLTSIYQLDGERMTEATGS